jgi:hypothetical protein
MKKTSIIFLLLNMSVQFVMAQPTQAEIDKMIKNMNAEIEKLKKDPKTAELAKNIPNLDTLKKSMPNENNQTVSKNPQKNFVPATLPLRNNKLLNSLPKKILSRQELVSFLSLLYTDLQNKLPAINSKAVQTIISQLNKNAAQIAGTGIVAWYKNDPAEAALLLVYAASQSPEDNTLNNCGAILNLCGLEEKAIPVLKYALANQPTNSTLLNNIGQAYTGLGDKDTAMYYLMGCIRQSPSHPEACATVAYIEYEKGNIEKAQQYAEQAIKGGYTPTIEKFYKGIKKNAKLTPLLENRLSQEKYFEFNGFTLPPNCRNWEQSEEVYAQQQSFNKKTDALLEKFKQITIQNSPTDLATINAVNWKEGPFYKMAQSIKDGISDLYNEIKMEAHTDYVNKISKSIEGQNSDNMALVNRYIPLFKAAEKNPSMHDQLIYQKCLDKVVLDNKWFEVRASLTDRYRDAWLERDIKHYNNLVFLTTMTAPNNNIYKSESATYATLLLAGFKNYVFDNCNPKNKPDCSKSDPAKEQNDNTPIFDQANCPIDIELPFVAGKIMLNCERFEIEGGEGIILNYKKDFITRESTVAIGIGEMIRIPGIEFGVKTQLYIKFDRNNQPIDGGGLMEAEFDVRGLANPDIKTGFTLGINSAFNHEAGALKGLTTERQMNNKVDLYKPKSKPD